MKKISYIIFALALTGLAFAEGSSDAFPIENLKSENSDETYPSEDLFQTFKNRAESLLSGSWIPDDPPFASNMESLVTFFNQIWVPQESEPSIVQTVKGIVFRFFKEGWIVCDQVVYFFDPTENSESLNIWETLKQSARKLSNGIEEAGRILFQSIQEIPIRLKEIASTEIEGPVITPSVTAEPSPLSGEQIAPSVTDEPTIAPPVVESETPLALSNEPALEDTEEQSEPITYQLEIAIALVSETKIEEKREPATELASSRSPSLEASEELATFNSSTPLMISSLLHPFGNNNGKAPVKENNGYPYPIPKNIWVKHVQGTNDNGAGMSFDSNFTTLGMMTAPDYRPGHFLPLVDLRVHRLDDGLYAGNIGVIARYVPNNNQINKLFGVNVYYDIDQGDTGYFQQVSVGIEAFSRRWEFRANAYAPIGASRKLYQSRYQYIGNYVAISNEYESVSFGFNAEVGYYMVRSKNFILFGSAGPYYLSGRKFHLSTAGGEIRLRPMYDDYIYLEGIYMYDPVFRSNWQLAICFNIPLYKLSKRNTRAGGGITDRQIYMPPVRYDVMPIGQICNWWTNF